MGVSQSTEENQPLLSESNVYYESMPITFTIIYVLNEPAQNHELVLTNKPAQNNKLAQNDEPVLNHELTLTDEPTQKSYINYADKTAAQIYDLLYKKYKFSVVHKNRLLKISDDFNIAVKNYYRSTILSQTNKFCSELPTINRLNAVIEAYCIFCFWIDDIFEFDFDKIPDNVTEALIAKGIQLKEECYYNPQSKYSLHHILVINIIDYTISLINKHDSHFYDMN